MRSQTKKQRRRQRQLTQAVYQSNPFSGSESADDFGANPPWLSGPPPQMNQRWGWLVGFFSKISLPTLARLAALVALLLLALGIKILFVGAWGVEGLPAGGEDQAAADAAAFNPDNLQGGQTPFSTAERTDRDAVKKLDDSADSSAAAAGGSPVAPKQIEVFVSGAVKRPGVYTLPVDSRVHHAVDAAGGLAQDADLAVINLAQILADESHVHIPKVGESAIENRSAGQGSTDPQIRETKRRVSLNRASVSEFQTLPGVGPVLAARIVQYREKQGKFSDVSQLQNVSGIGPSLLAALHDYVKL